MESHYDGKRGGSIAMALAQDETTIDFIVVGIVAIVIGYIVYELVDSGSSSSSGGGGSDDEASTEEYRLDLDAFVGHVITPP